MADQIFREIFDDSEILASLERIEKGLKQTGEAGTDAANTMRDSFSAAEREVQILDETLAKTNKSVSDQARQAQAAKQANQSWLSSIRQTIAGQQIGGKTLSEWGEGARGFAARIKDGAKAVEGATVAQRIFNGVLKASGIGLLVGLLASVISYFTRWQAGIDKVSQLMAGLDAVVNTIVNRFASFGSAIVKLFSGDFSGAAEDAKAAVSGIGAAIVDAAVAAYELEKRIQALRDATITASAEISRQQTALQGFRQVVDDGTQAIGRRIKAQKEAAKIELDIARKRFDQALEEQQIEQQRFLLSTKNAEDKQKLADAGIRLDEAQRALNDAIFNGEKEARDLRKEASEAAKKQSEVRKKALEEEAKALEALRRELDRLRLTALGDSLDADLLAVNQKYDELVRSAQNGVTKYNEIEAKRGLSPEEQAARQEYASLSVKLEEQRLGAILDVLNEYNQKEIEATKEQIERRKALSEKEQKEAEDRIKAQKQLRDIGLQLGQQQAEAYLLRLKEQGASEKEINDTRAELDLEGQKARLESELAFQRQLLLVVDAGDKERIAQIQATIALLEQEVGNVVFQIENKPKKPFSLLSLIGLDPENDKEKIKAIAESLSTTFDLIRQANQAELERQQAIVQAIDDRIAKQEEAINREAELAKQGLANDLDIEKQRLLELQKQRDEAAKQEAKARRAAVALDTIQQASSLITASANVFKTVSALGPFGIPLAISLITAMFGAFAAAKAKAFKAAEVPKFRKGGKLGGHSHDDGGNPIFDREGNRIGEVERDEWIIGTAPSREHNGFLERLNKGEFKGVDLNRLIPMKGRYQNPAEGAASRIGKIEARRADASEARHWNALRSAYGESAEKIVQAIREQPEVMPWKSGYKRIVKRGNVEHVEVVTPAE